MNELQVQTIEIKPAVIKFNYSDVEKALETSLENYKGLVYTEEKSTELRKTLAELRKGKNLVDRYRIDTKKKLNEPVTQFEDQCKKLDKKFNDVITPLAKQLDEFEEKRRNKKLAELEKIRSEHIETHDLSEEYHDQVEISDHMLTKGVSLNQASESLEFIVRNLKMEQDKKIADKQLIETTVKLANSENELGFSADAYVRLLDFKDVEVVKNQIEADVKKEVENRRLKKEAEERAEQERLEREKQVELERLAQEEHERIKREKEQLEQAEIESDVGIPLGFEPTSVSIDDLPFSDDPFADFEEDPFEETIEMPEVQISDEVESVIKLKTNKDNLNELLKFLNDKEIEFEVIG